MDIQQYLNKSKQYNLRGSSQELVNQKLNTSGTCAGGQQAALGQLGIQTQKINMAEIMSPVQLGYSNSKAKKQQKPGAHMIQKLANHEVQRQNSQTTKAQAQVSESRNSRSKLSKSKNPNSASGPGMGQYVATSGSALGPSIKINEPNLMNTGTAELYATQTKLN